MLVPDPGHEAAPLQLFGQVYDRFSRARLCTVGLGHGARVLDVGAGAGTVAVWAAERVGPRGQVVATDRDPRHVPPRDGLQVERHDLAGDELDELHGGYGFDLVFVRQVLSQLPRRWTLLAALADALAPGGALVVEELAGAAAPQGVLRPDEARPQQLMELCHRTLWEVVTAAGVDPDWDVPTAVARAGLVELDCELWSRAWPGGSAGARLWTATVDQVRHELVDRGMPGQEVAALRRQLTRPELVVQSIPIRSVAARARRQVRWPQRRHPQPTVTRTVMVAP